MSDFSTDFLDKQKKILLEQREKILKNFQNFSQETKKIGEQTFTEEGDQAQQLLDQKLSISLRERDLRLLREIDLALAKLEDGSYGYCEESGEPIEAKRLEKQPWARLSIYYAEIEEREKNKYFKRATS